MKGLIVPSLVIIATGIFVAVAYADSEHDTTTVEQNQVTQVLNY